MARTKHICPNKGTSIHKITLCVSVSPSLPPSICSLASKSPLFAPKIQKTQFLYSSPKQRSERECFSAIWVSVDVKTNCVTLTLNICPNWDRLRILRNLHLFLGQVWDQKGPPSTLLQRSTIRRKNKLSSFLRQILRFLPLGNIRRFIRLGFKGVPKPFPHLKRGHRTAPN